MLLYEYFTRTNVLLKKNILKILYFIKEHNIINLMKIVSNQRFV